MEIDIQKNVDSQNWLKDSYRRFLQRPIPKVLETYSFQEDYVLLDVFIITPQPEKVSKLIMPESTTDTEKGFMHVSIARVLGTSAKEYEIGDIVRLSDYKCSVFKNVKYEEWHALGKRGGNIEKIGDAPPQFITKFHESFMRYTFVPNPVLENTMVQKLFLVPKHEILAKIKDPDALITN